MSLVAKSLGAVKVIMVHLFVYCVMTTDTLVLFYFYYWQELKWDFIGREPEDWLQRENRRLEIKLNELQLILGTCCDDLTCAATLRFIDSLWFCKIHLT